MWYPLSIFLLHLQNSRRIFFVSATDNTAELQWLEHLWDHETGSRQV